MKKKSVIFSIIGVGVASLLVFAGCTQFAAQTGNVISLEENFSYSQMPSWSEESVKFLEKEGWEVYQHEGIYQMKQGEKEPVTFNATNKDRTCNVLYTVGTSPEGQSLISNDYYLTNNRVENELLMDNVKVIETNTDNNILTNKSDARLQTFTVLFSKEAAFVGVDGTPQNENTIMTTRSFAGAINNPFTATELVPTTTGGEASERKVDKINANITITYSCVGEDIDTDLWKQVLEKAKVNF